MKCKVEIVDGETQKVLAGQRDATLNRSAETLDATSKDSDGWKENETGYKEWSIDAGGLLIQNDEAYDHLEEKWFEGENLDVIVTIGNKKYAGNAVLTDFPSELPYEDLVTYSISLQGSGPLTKTIVPPTQG